MYSACDQCASATVTAPRDCHWCAASGSLLGVCRESEELCPSQFGIDIGQVSLNCAETSFVTTATNPSSGTANTMPNVVSESGRASDWLLYVVVAGIVACCLLVGLSVGVYMVGRSTANDDNSTSARKHCDGKLLFKTTCLFVLFQPHQRLIYRR